MDDRAVVLVEDNPFDEELMLRAFKKAEVRGRVITLRDGAEALDYFFAREAYAGRSLADVPLVVLLDLKLPKVDGLEVLRALRADPRTKLLPIVILTSSTEVADMQRSYQLGANSYVRKPNDFTALVEVVRQLGAYWLGINRAAPV